MTAAWIIVLLLVAFVLSRVFRSTKIWWSFISAIMAGLLVGLLSKEVVKSTKVDNATTFTQLVNTVNDESVACMQNSTELIVEDPTITVVAGYIAKPYSFDALTSTTATNGRDSPAIEDDS